ncbi:candidapepsin-3 [Plectosphaerella cucumerina]|uniref:Probable aspartic-type endopeptidase OPSB n=1 Tax=Plectosphaerella cucumerina TaxID=40658 RepID=A0A8K0T6G1_9PEZI|nr:candidapepsin-3 [Plectosphaerella cucumerina]
MKAMSIWALGALVLSANALVLEKRQDGGPPLVVGLDTQRRHVVNPHLRDQERRRRRRDGHVQATLDNMQTLYFVNASVGNPPQQVRLHLDTGSSDLWLNTPNSALCREQDRPCAVSGTYSANSSSTYSYVGSYFNISYVDGSGASGDYVTDTFSIGASRLDNFQFGIGYQSTAAQSILGIGYKSNEVQVNRAGLKPYDNLPAKMASQGLIRSNAFSLYLNSLQSSTGTILFGGVDTEHYVGQLQTLPIQGASNGHSEFLITLTGVSLGSTVLADNMALAVLLDSGSSLTYLPDAMVSQIFEMVGAVYQEQEAVAFVDCRLAEVQANMTFTFSNPRITVNLSELVVDMLQITGRRPTFANGVDACLFGIAPAGRGTNVLGDTFMRSAYIVYDLDNNEISLAQTRFNASTSNILQIGSGKGAVPSAVGVASPVSATQGVSSGVNRGNNSGAALRPLLAAVAALTASTLVGALLCVV